jgi:CHAT domain-containing protein
MVGKLLTVASNLTGHRTMQASTPRFPAILALLILVSVPAKALASGPQTALAEADRLAMLYNWPRAMPLYADAEREFRRLNDPRGALAARLGWLRAEAYEEPSAALAAEVERDLRNPIVQGDTGLMLRCLVAKAAIEEQVNEDYSRATWEKIQELAKGLGDRRWQARAQAELGIIAFLDGDVATATRALKAALVSLYLQGDMGAAIYYGSIVGNGKVEAGEPEAGIKYCETAIQTAGTVKDMGFPFMAYEGKARGLIALHRNAEAKQVLDEAIRQVQVQNALAAEAQLLVVRGKQEAMVNRQQAIKDLAAAIDFCRQHRFRHALAWSTFELATVYRDQGDFAQAERYATAAERETEALDDRYHLPEDLALMADLAAASGRTRGADSLYRRAEDVTEGLLVSLPSRQVESSLIGGLSNIYVGHFRLVAGRLNNVPEGFRILESARGRAIADQLRSGAPLRSPDDRITQAARKELNRLQIELLHATSPEERGRLLERLFDTEQVLAPTGESNTGLQKAALRANPVTMRALQDSLSLSEAVLEYVLDDPQSFCLYVTRDRAGLSPLPASREEVGKLVAAYREEISGRLPSTTSAARLYSVLVKPVPVAVLKTDLVVIPDGELNLIPFDALTDATGEYVLASHVVSYAPSATVLNLIRETKRPNPASITFLGVGGVPYGRSATSAVANTKPGVQGPPAAISNPFDLKADPLPDLPNSTDEVTSAGEIFGKSSVLLLGVNATEAAFKAKPLDRFRIIHIATHGIASVKLPDRAALILGEDPAGHDDGLLQAREIRDLRLNADLVTLSACDTGMGRLEGEEGIENVERAFLFAGARSVLASLWAASDLYTTTLITQFYRNLAAGQSEGQALRNAKLELLKKFGSQTAPFYWAGFTLVGDASVPVVTVKH